MYFVMEAMVRQYCIEVGKLLYVVADMDEAIAQPEKRSLLDLVIMQVSKPGAENPDYSTFESPTPLMPGMKPYEAMESFIRFIEEYESWLEPVMIETACKLVTNLADAYALKNRKEKHLLHALNMKLCMLCN
jgi:hypothetical protein